jgi:hypothetical protein
MRFRVTWSGVVRKTIAIETPADALYHVWSRHRDDFAGGAIEVSVDEGGRGVRLARLGFPVTIEREIEAATPADAVRSFLYDDRVPSLVHVQDISVVPAALPAGAEQEEPALPALAQAAE